MSIAVDVAQLKTHIMDNTFTPMIPLGAAAEMLGLTKSGLLSKAGKENSRLELMSITSAAGTVWNGVTVESLLEEIDHQENHRPRAAQRALECLHELAIARKTAEYGEFMQEIGLTLQNPYHRRLIGELLGTISTNFHDRCGIMPSVLVVSKATGRPSDPFFQLSLDYGAYNKKEQSDAEYFEEMKEKVFDSAKRKNVWAWRKELGE